MTPWLRRGAPWLLAVVLTLLVCAPLTAPGFVLSYDMVWVPHLDLSRADVWGLGSALPRAVPSDAVVALLGAVVPAVVVQKVLLVGSLLLAGVGTEVWLRAHSLRVRLPAVALAIWNPFVAERLALGQWPVVAAWAATPWLLAGLGGERVRWRMVVVALAVTALSPATGLMGALVAVVVVLAHHRVRRDVLLTVVAAVGVNAPWVVAGLTHASSATSDPSAVGLFDVQPEGTLGRVGAVLGLGGVWNADVAPGSRGLWTTTVLVAVGWVLMVVGVRRLVREQRRTAVSLGVLAVVGVVLALAGWLVPSVVAGLADHVPGGGIVRDGTRYLLLLAPLEVLCLGLGVETVTRRVRDVDTARVLVVVAVLLPLAALPDLAWGVGGQLRTTHYPSSWSTARDAVARLRTPGDVLVLPFSAYRQPAWNHDRPVLDPAGRFFDRDTVVQDALSVSGHLIAGEDPRAAAVGRVLAAGAGASALAREGIGVVVVERGMGSVSLPSGLVRVSDTGRGFDVYTVPGVRVRHASSGARLAVVVAWLAAGVTLLVGVVLGGRRRSERQPAEQRARDVPQS